MYVHIRFVVCTLKINQSEIWDELYRVIKHSYQTLPSRKNTAACEK